MNELDVRQQLLVILMEECGELIQECSKCLRKADLYGSKDLIKEIGDVQCMIDLLQQYDVVSYTEIEERVAVKTEKLKVWSDLIE